MSIDSTYAYCFIYLFFVFLLLLISERLTRYSRNRACRCAYIAHSSSNTFDTQFRMRNQLTIGCCDRKNVKIRISIDREFVLLTYSNSGDIGFGMRRRWHISAGQCLRISFSVNSQSVLFTNNEIAERVTRFQITTNSAAVHTSTN